MQRDRCANTLPEKRKYLHKPQHWSQQFTAKWVCNVEFWLERVPQLIGLREISAMTIQNSGLGPFIDTEESVGETPTGATETVALPGKSLEQFHE